jgi:sugar lactone lactonase YvrE
MRLWVVRGMLGVRALAIAFLVTIAACGGGGGSGVAVPHASAAPVPQQLLYVVEETPSASETVVSIAPASAAAASTIGPIAGQLAIAVSRDGSGALFMETRANSTDEMSAYAPGAVSPSWSFPIQPHLGPVRFALDASGLLYMPGGSLNELDVYNAQTGALVRSIPESVNDPFAIAIGAGGLMYIACHNPEVVAVFDPGSSSAAYVIPISSGTPRGLAVDGSGRLYVVNALPQSGNVQVFQPGATVASATITENGPSDVGVDSAGNVYVAVSNDALNVYAPDLGPPLSTIQLAGIPDGIAI